MMRTVTSEGENNHLIIMLHGTGGSADSLFNLGNYLDPKASLVGIEGEVMENGMRRYFERYPDGSFKLKSLAQETQKLHNTLLKVIEQYSDKKITLLGYSNGANIALNILKEYENVPINHALLYHPSPVREEVSYKNQDGLKVLITSGANDPFISAEQFERLNTDLSKVMETKSYTHELGHQLIQEELDVSKELLGDRYE